MRDKKKSVWPVCLILAAVFGICIPKGAYAEFIYQESGGVVRGEGEIFSSRTHLVNGSTTNGWFVVPDERAGAGTNINARNDAYIQLLPDNGTGTALLNPPEVRYKMNISTPGTYRLYLRREGNTSTESSPGSSDSMFMDIVELKDGTSPAFGTGSNEIADWYEATGYVDGDFATVPWSSMSGAEVNTGFVTGTNAEWNITSPGIYTLRFTGREDGAAIDAWAFQLNTLSPPIGNGNLYYESGGIVVGEAEIFSDRTHNISGSSSNGWFVIPDESDSAGIFTNARENAFIQLLPDDNTWAGPNVPPEVEYQMNIITPGTYRLYLRWDGVSTNSGASDSMYMDIVELKDGTSPEFGTSTNLIADWYEMTRSTVDSNFSTAPWSNDADAEVNTGYATGDSAEWTITNAGIYTLRFTEREDGCAVDSWIFQLSSLPAPTGYGIPMTSLVPTSSIIAPIAGDTYLRRAGTNENYGIDDVIRVKNDVSSGIHPLDRLTYLQFDLPDMEGQIVTNASLQITLVGVDGNTNDHDIYVAVISEDAADETFNELTLTPATSDVFDPDSDVPVDFSKIRGGAACGSFSINGDDVGTIVSFSSPGFIQAIKDDTDGVLALVLYREQDNNSVDDFASKENTTSIPPHLLIEVRDPLQNGTRIIIL